MVIRLVQIGNSRGIRIPKQIIDQFSFNDEIEAEVKKEGLLLKKKTKPRSGWKKQILSEIKKNGAPDMIIPDDIQNDFQASGWEW